MATTHPHPKILDPRNWCPLCEEYAAEHGHGCPPCEDQAQHNPTLATALAQALETRGAE